MSGTWSENWQDRTRRVVQEMGFDDVYTFVMSHPEKSFGELFGMLRDATDQIQSPIAFIQLPELFYDDANQRECLREAFMESLVRSLQQFVKKGWNQGKKARTKRINARTNWPVPSQEFDRWQALKCAIWKELELIKPPEDWCPASRKDPIVQDVFERVWPEDNSKDTF